MTRGDSAKAMEYELCAMHCYPRKMANSDGWLALAEWSTELKLPEFTQYFLRKAMQMNKPDMEILQWRWDLYHEMGQPHNATKVIIEYLRYNPHDMQITKSHIANLQSKGKHRLVIHFLSKALAAQIRRGIYPDTNALTMLTEIYYKEKMYKEAAQCVELKKEILECPSFTIVEASNPLQTSSSSTSSTTISLLVPPTQNSSSMESSQTIPTPESNKQNQNEQISIHLEEDRKISDNTDSQSGGWVGQFEGRNFREQCHDILSQPAQIQSASELCRFVFYGSCIFENKEDVTKEKQNESMTSKSQTNSLGVEMKAIESWMKLPISALLLRGQCLMRLDRVKEAEEESFHIILHSNVHENAKQIFCVGEELRSRGNSNDLIRARNIYLYLIGNGEIWPGLCVSIGIVTKQLYETMGGNHLRIEAKLFFEKALSSIGAQSDAATHLAEIYEIEGRMEDAIAMLKMHLRCVEKVLKGQQRQKSDKSELQTHDNRIEKSKVIEVTEIEENEDVSEKVEEVLVNDEEEIVQVEKKEIDNDDIQFQTNMNMSSKFKRRIWNKFKLRHYPTFFESLVRGRVSLCLVLEKVKRYDEFSELILQIFREDPFVGIGWREKWSFLVEYTIKKQSHAVTCDSIWKHLLHDNLGLSALNIRLELCVRQSLGQAPQSSQQPQRKLTDRDNQMIQIQANQLKSVYQKMKNKPNKSDLLFPSIFSILPESFCIDVLLSAFFHLFKSKRIESYPVMTEILEGVLNRVKLKDNERLRRLVYFCGSVMITLGQKMKAEVYLRPWTNGEFDQSIWELFRLSVKESVFFKAAVNRTLNHQKGWGEALIMGHRSIAKLRRKPIMTLQNYYLVLQSFPSDPLIHLCLAVKYFSILWSRKNVYRGEVYMSGLAHLSCYFHLRKKDDELMAVSMESRRGGKESSEQNQEVKRLGCYTKEAFYNVGRAFHQLGMYFIAIPFYEITLGIDLERNIDAVESVFQIGSIETFEKESISSDKHTTEISQQSQSRFSQFLKRKREEFESSQIPQKRKCNEQETQPPSINSSHPFSSSLFQWNDISYEAAYNLSRIYLKSGNPQLSRDIIRRFLVI
jgi:tetratricopeptide (TPR) repeat protein